METGCVRTVANVIKDVRNNWAFDEDLVVDIPKFYYNLKEITIRIPQLNELDILNCNVSLKAGPSEKIRKVGSILVPLLLLYLSTTIVVFYQKNCGLTRSKELLPYVHYVLFQKLYVRKLLCAVNAPLCSRNSDRDMFEITSDSQQDFSPYILIECRVSRTPFRMYGQDFCDEAISYVLEA